MGHRGATVPEEKTFHIRGTYSRDGTESQESEENHGYRKPSFS
jgi:hypothetical protein